MGKVEENRRNLHKYRNVKNNETQLILEVKRFLKDNQDLLILKSDKGGVTVQ